ncbi:MAG: hypothetical protein E6H69_02555 [Betaproteobacteria bacterium]|nr:MAG: hypothetical protein E6H69_02555 [Betaproteobacteria bacterium]
MLTLLVAASIFLNGVNIDGVKAQSFEKCRSVRLDEKGNVHLECPGYQAESLGGSGLPTIPVAGASLVTPRLSKHYFLVTEQNDELTGEIAENFGDVDGSGSLQCSRLGDLQPFAVNGRFHLALDHQHIAVRDFHALQFNVDTDKELAARRLG